MFNIFSKKLKIDHRRSNLQEACNIDISTNNAILNVSNRVEALGTVSKKNIKKLNLTEKERLSMVLYIMLKGRPSMMLQIVNILGGKKFTKQTKTIEYLYRNLEDISLVRLTEKLIPQ